MDVSETSKLVGEPWSCWWKSTEPMASRARPDGCAKARARGNGGGTLMYHDVPWLPWLARISPRRVEILNWKQDGMKTWRSLPNWGEGIRWTCKTYQYISGHIKTWWKQWNHGTRLSRWNPHSQIGPRSPDTTNGCSSHPFPFGAAFPFRKGFAHRRMDPPWAVSFLGC